LKLQNVNGPVEVQGWDRRRRSKSAPSKPPSIMSPISIAVTIDVSAKAGSVSVMTHYPRTKALKSPSSILVRVPRGARVEHVGTINGTVSVVGVDSIDDLHTVNGNIEVYDRWRQMSTRIRPTATFISNWHTCWSNRRIG